MKVKFLFAWYDCWVGLFWDAKKRRLYIFPIPMCGVVLQFPFPKFCCSDREAEISDWKIVAHNMKVAQRHMEGGTLAGRYSWMDAPIDIAESRAKQIS